METLSLTLNLLVKLSLVDVYYVVTHVFQSLKLKEEEGQLSVNTAKEYAVLASQLEFGLFKEGYYALKRGHPAFPYHKYRHTAAKLDSKHGMCADFETSTHTNIVAWILQLITCLKYLKELSMVLK